MKIVRVLKDKRLSVLADKIYDHQTVWSVYFRAAGIMNPIDDIIDGTINIGERFRIIPTRIP